jgi:hypothetical protein
MPWGGEDVAPSGEQLAGLCGGGRPDPDKPLACGGFVVITFVLPLLHDHIVSQPPPFVKLLS